MKFVTILCDITEGEVIEALDDEGQLDSSFGVVQTSQGEWTVRVDEEAIPLLEQAFDLKGEYEDGKIGPL